MREPDDYEIELEPAGSDPLWFRMFLYAAAAAYLFVFGLIVGVMVSR